MNIRLLPLLSTALVALDTLADDRPNIILFLVDDLGWQDTSVPMWTQQTHYNATFHTPNMERLAAEGMTFTSAYAASISSPSRCSLMTGTNAARHRVTNWTMLPDAATDDPHPLCTPPTWNIGGISATPDVPRTYTAQGFVSLLRAAGYHTIHCGKAHFGALHTPGEDPRHWGFDVNIAGHAAGGLATYLSEHNYGHRPDGTPYALNAIPGLEKYWGTGTFATEALTREAIAALEHHKGSDSPFFLYMAHYAVHIPIDRDPRYYARYIAQGLDPREAAYASLVEGVDKSLGDLMDWLESNGERERTVVLLMSDNGGLATQSEWRSGALYTQNAPLSSGKGSLREGGIRVPMIAAWPGHIAPETRCDALLLIEDFFPTILSLAEVGDYRVPQPIDGESFAPLLLGQPSRHRHRPLVWHFPNVWGNEGPGINLCSAIRLGRWKLIYHYDTGQKELYDIPADIGEQHDLSRRHPAIVRRLSRRLGRYLRSVGAQRPTFRATGQPCPWPDE